MMQQYQPGSSFADGSARRLLFTVLSVCLLANSALAGADTVLVLGTGNAGAQAATTEEAAELETEDGNDEASGCAEPETAQLDGLLLAAVTGTAAGWPAHNGSFAPRRLSSAVAADEITDCCSLTTAEPQTLRQRSDCPWYLYNETDAHRYPPTVVQARYLSASGCSGSCAGHHSCQSVTVQRTVLRYTGDCAAGVKVYAPSRLSVTVGYVCAIRPSAL